MAKTMSSSTKQGEDRRQRTRQLIDKMLAQREQLMALLCEVSGVEPFATQKPLSELLEEFCQVLVDYIASGHFGLYERIAVGTERRKAVVRLAQQSYAKIVDTTQVALDFNEKYDNMKGRDDLEILQPDLWRLGEELATRVELEDKLIECLIGSEGKAVPEKQPH
ncbi:MAG: sigma D regulator [Gammaproteobacteria bacterium]|nr:sigma D regulator [Gammaproteobacteria bacterium]MCI0590586.1 sigma D regulator [Gammaproteobacteria bacterium]